MTINKLLCKGQWRAVDIICLQLMHYVWIHQVRTLVFDDYQRCPVPLPGSIIEVLEVVLLTLFCYTLPPTFLPWREFCQSKISLKHQMWAFRNLISIILKKGYHCNKEEGSGLNDCTIPLEKLADWQPGFLDSTLIFRRKSFF